jgi:hypothetical protein
MSHLACAVLQPLWDAPPLGHAVQFCTPIPTAAAALKVPGHRAVPISVHINTDFQWSLEAGIEGNICVHGSSGGETVSHLGR